MLHCNLQKDNLEDVGAEAAVQCYQVAYECQHTVLQLKMLLVLN